MTRLLRLVPAALLLIGLAPACAASPDTEEGEESASSSIARGDAVARARQWVDAKLQYCGAPNGANSDPLCKRPCRRQSNPSWDRYRSDCSGLVSWSWGLPAPGRVTTGFAPFDSSVSRVIQAADLQPGDAVNSESHVALFVGWITHGRRARLIDEHACGTPAREYEVDVTISGTRFTRKDWSSNPFTAIRFVDIQSGSPPSTPLAKPSTPKGCDWIRAGTGIVNGEAFSACSNTHTLAMQNDGNLVLYHDGRGAIWSAGTTGAGYAAIMQSDGNFVVYDKSLRPLWSSGTYGRSGAALRVQGDGNLVVYASSGAPLWSSNTAGR